MDIGDIKYLVKTKKLSEAMRIGAQTTDQAVGSLFSEGRTCAIGAVLLGRGASKEVEYHNDGLHEIAPELFNPSGFYTLLAEKIFNMNDHGKMTREAIADWLETQGY